MRKLLAFVIALSFANIAFAEVINPDEDKEPSYPTLSPKPDSIDTFYAHPGPIPSRPDSYLGISAAFDSSKVKQTAKTAGATDVENSYSGNGIAVQIFAGTGKNFNHLYLGGEGAFIYSLNKGKHSATEGGASYDTTIKMPMALAVDFKPGYLINTNWLIYGRIGVIASSFKLSTDYPDLFHVDDTNKMAVGARLGLGVDYYISDECSIRFDYIYSKYSKVTANYTATNNTTYENEFAPSNNQFMFGIAYHF